MSLSAAAHTGDAFSEGNARKWGNGEMVLHFLISPSPHFLISFVLEGVS
jgi:hypothetical protein